MRALKTKKSRAALLALAATGLASMWFVGVFGPKHTTVGQSLAPFAVVDNVEADELSGLVASQQYPGVLWSHNDSGNAPRLFALTTKGGLVVPPEGGEPSQFPGIEVKGAKLVDWESIARRDRTLYVCDTGNNFSARRDLGVYVVKEPDPYHDLSAEVERFISVRYPEQSSFPPTEAWRYDSEGAFCTGDYLYILTKERPAFRLFIQQGSSSLYRLSLKDSSPAQVLEKVDRIDGLGGWVTAADVTEDGRWVALLCESPQQSIWLFECPEKGGKLLSEAKSVRRFLFYNGGQVEAMAFVPNKSLYLVNEKREMFRVPLESFEQVKP